MRIIMKQDDTFCIDMSLQVMKEQRQKLVKDTLNKDYVLFSGLHESEPAVQDLYFQYYLIEWFDNHWTAMLETLERHPEYSNDKRKEMVLFYAEYFKKMLNKTEASGVLSKLLIPDLLRLQRESVEELLALASSWELKNNELRLIFKKHKEQFEHKIASLENKQ